MTALTVPACLAQLTPAWLRAISPEFAHLAGLRAERMAEGVGMATELYRLALDYSGDGPAGPPTLVAKLPSSLAAMREIARAVGLYEREAHFYREIAPTINLRTPRCHLAQFEPGDGGFLLLLEDLADATPGDQVAGLSLAQASLAIDQVAGLHARWWQCDALAGLASVIPPTTEPPYAGHGARHAAGWETFDRFLEGRVSRETRRVGERLGATLDRLAQEMSTPPLTVCHGDFRADNLMFGRNDAGALILTCLDWQLAMQTRGTFDVGYMMSGGVDVEIRREHERALLTAYHDRLIRSGVEGYAFAECFQDYRRALLIGLTYLSQSGAAADLTHPRAEALYDVGVRRIDAAISDLDLAEFVD